MMQPATIINALTIDVEDYFHVSAFADRISTDQWSNFESRVVPNTRRLLAILDQHQTRATFFVLGWVADQYPSLVCEIHRAGHEIGCHSYWHKLVYNLTPDEFRADLCRSRNALQDIIGESVTLYRAPSFSITRNSWWSYEVLAEEGFTVDSSVFPIVHDRYGIPDAEPRPHWVETPAGVICEFPAAVRRFCGMNVPVSGGGYFRLYPSKLNEFLLSQVNRSGIPFTFYIHPWEIDPDQPRMSGTRLSRFRHYLNLDATEGKFHSLLRRFHFSTMTESLESHGFGVVLNRTIEQQPISPSIRISSLSAEPPKPKVLFVTHRVPHPPNRGDRIRTYNILKHLSRRYRVSLACLADEPVSTETHRELDSLCDQVSIVPTDRIFRWGRALWSLIRRGTISEGAFQSPQLTQVIRRWAALQRFEITLCSSSALAHYLETDELKHARRYVDLIDVDSQKWFDYADESRPPKSWLFRKEGQRLRQLESRIGRTFHGLLAVSEDEVSLFRRFADYGNIHAVPNGVDLDYFQPVAEPENHERPGRCVFVGALDYNIDGVVWFCHHVWPAIRALRPDATLELVGREPVKAVQQLGRIDGVHVSGTVPDVRPHLAEAEVAIVPLRIARGVQNKMLEALAMSKAVVASHEPTVGLRAESGTHFLTANTVEEWVESVSELLVDDIKRTELGYAGRLYVQTYHQWTHCLERLDALLELPRPDRQRSTDLTHANHAIQAASTSPID